jgi:Domain of Unknown Function (DUF1080)
MVSSMQQFRKFSPSRGAIRTLSTVALLTVWLTPRAQPDDAATKPATASKGFKEIGTEWTPLFDGKTLNGWKVTQFGGEGPVETKGGELVLGTGNNLTGVTIDRPIPRTNYEVTLEAKRVEGSDFFCGLTFPVNKDPCSLVLGGWGGGVCGLSSIDGNDASENETTKYRKFDKGRWYAVRLRVTDKKIEAWLDNEQIVDQELADHSISIRIEVQASRPFGLASYETKAALRNIRIRRLK